VIGPHGSVIFQPGRFTGGQPFPSVSSPLMLMASVRVMMEVPPRMPMVAPEVVTDASP
jgi:hypothetical protein